MRNTLLMYVFDEIATLSTASMERFKVKDNFDIMVICPSPLPPCCFTSLWTWASSYISVSMWMAVQRSHRRQISASPSSSSVTMRNLCISRDLRTIDSCVCIVFFCVWTKQIHGQLMCRFWYAYAGNWNRIFIKRKKEKKHNRFWREHQSKRFDRILIAFASSNAKKINGTMRVETA